MWVAAPAGWDPPRLTRGVRACDVPHVYAETIVGRAPELATLSEFLAAPGALMLTGGPGIGKTTLWESATRWRASVGCGC